MVNRYRKGRIAEKKVVNYLKERGFKNVRRSKGSRGPADIYAFKDGRKHYIQVKSGSANLTTKGRRRLRALAKQRGGAAHLIKKEGKSIKWKFLGDWSR